MNGLSYLHLELTMHEEPRQPAWPADVSIAAFSHEYARATHDLLVRAYANGGGSVAGFDNWYNGLITDNEYDPELAVLVYQAHRSVAFVQCWNSAFIRDLVVDPGRRREGLGEALLVHVLRLFCHRGQTTVSLKVERDNPSGAEKLYRRLGFSEVPAAKLHTKA
ncbi:GNAT family N-acetyltransferase [Brucella intermedia]|uniref:GNAT family N-acetyltransferase n=1 Tax=Brucella intermedia TaxID=94625 RepID=UPI001FCE46F4|nr:GNAT family N-acetyltransferase [Brucella intermedia]